MNAETIDGDLPNRERLPGFNDGPEGIMKHRLRYIAKWIFHYVFSPLVPHMPFPLLRQAAKILGTLNYFVNSKVRHAIEANLKMTFPEKPEQEVREICRWNFINHAMHSLEILYLPSVDEKFIEKYIRVKNLEYFTRAVEDKKGIILILGHIGFYYLSGVTLQLRSAIPLNDISQDTSKLDIGALDRKILEKRLSNYQSRIDGRIFHRGGSLLGVIKAIKRNEAVSLFIDAFATEKDPVVNLLDKRARAPQGPIRMAMQTGAAIIFITATRERDGTMTFTFFEPVQLESTGDKQEDLRRNSQKCIDLLDPVIRQHPDQWHLWRLWHERYIKEEKDE